MSTWHYMKNGVQTGPVSTDELRSLLASGALSSSTLVWRDGLSGWLAANSLPEFAGSLPPPPPSSTGIASGGKPGEFVPDAADVEKNKVFGLLSYLPPLLFIVPLIAAKESKFAMYHCNQGLVLTLTAFAIWIANMILGFILAFIPVLGWILILLLHLGAFFGLLTLAIIGILNAVNGRCKPLPVIGNHLTLVK